MAVKTLQQVYQELHQYRNIKMLYKTLKKNSLGEKPIIEKVMDSDLKIYGIQLKNSNTSILVTYIDEYVMSRDYDRLTRKYGNSTN